MLLKGQHRKNKSDRFRDLYLCWGNGLLLGHRWLLLLLSQTIYLFCPKCEQHFPQTNILCPWDEGAPLILSLRCNSSFVEAVWFWTLFTAVDNVHYVTLLPVAVTQLLNPFTLTILILFHLCMLRVLPGKSSLKSCSIWKISATVPVIKLISLKCSGYNCNNIKITNWRQ